MRRRHRVQSEAILKSTHFHISLNTEYSIAQYSATGRRSYKTQKSLSLSPTILLEHFS